MNVNVGKTLARALVIFAAFALISLCPVCGQAKEAVALQASAATPPPGSEVLQVVAQAAMGEPRSLGAPRSLGQSRSLGKWQSEENKTGFNPVTGYFESSDENDAFDGILPLLGLETSQNAEDGAGPAPTSLDLILLFDWDSARRSDGILIDPLRRYGAAPTDPALID